MFQSVGLSDPANQVASESEVSLCYGIGRLDTVRISMQRYSNIIPVVAWLTRLSSMTLAQFLTLTLVSSFLYACGGSGSDSETIAGNGISPENQAAAITAVSINGTPGSYTFSVTVESPDTGCSQYADWWEVLSADGDLIYRRILTHSHVNEQPFTRSGGPVAITATDQVIVRAHMNSVGYGELAFTGNVEQGLVADSIDSSLAEVLEIADPLPDGCAF